MPRPDLQYQDQDQDRNPRDRDQDQDREARDQDQDQDRKKPVSRPLKTKTAVSRLQVWLNTLKQSYIYRPTRNLAEGL